MRMRLFGLSMAAFLLAASPAFAQNGDDVQYNAVCQNILGSIGDITNTQTGTANAAAEQYSEAAAEVAQEQGVSLEQINACLNGAAGADTDGKGTKTAGTDVKGAVLTDTIPEQKVLANTGGPALLLPALGLLLISSVAFRNLLRR